MKYTVKQNLIIFHKKSEWIEFSEKLFSQYPPSYKISWVCRRELGFVVREYNGPTGNGSWTREYCLDFFDPAMQTFFIMKWL